MEMTTLYGRWKPGRGFYGAGDGIRTRDIDLGKVALYQLSYSRSNRETFIVCHNSLWCQTAPLTGSDSASSVLKSGQAAVSKGIGRNCAIRAGSDGNLS
jgi:hypothetical protein